jgi:ATP-binding cassette subfamily F protein uup
MLADYEGALILVSHDRDFIDRLASSTIALDGRGAIVETPGGWADFTRQNPGFFDAARAADGGSKTAPAKPAAPPAASRKPTKLSFKDEHRLKALDGLMPKLAAEIETLEAALADAGLYARDPKAFDAATRRHAAAQVELAAAEEEWLALEEKREALASG